MLPPLDFIFSANLYTCICIHDIIKRLSAAATVDLQIMDNTYILINDPEMPKALSDVILVNTIVC